MVSYTLHRLDDDPDFRELVEHELPEVYRWTDPQRYARYQAFRHLPGVEMVPSRAFTTWLSKQGQTSTEPSSCFGW